VGHPIPEVSARKAVNKARSDHQAVRKKQRVWV
jgi:hypothetical protein